MPAPTRSSLVIIFTTVLIDLIGFGMVIPLVSLYGRHYGASGFSLAVLGGIFSFMQFFFASFWGRLSDRLGRRPVLLFSLLGSSLSYLIFGLAPNLTCLLLARAVAGIFTANISIAQAYIADVTSLQERAKGMGLIGAAFGIGFTLGPPLGGFASHHFGLHAPGLIAAMICGCNFLFAIFRLPESLPVEARKTVEHSWFPISREQLVEVFNNPQLRIFILLFFSVTFAFSNMEQTFALFFQERLHLTMSEAGLKTGMVLMMCGMLGAILQGLCIPRLVKRFGERALLLGGLVFSSFAMVAFPLSSTYWVYLMLAIPLALGSAFMNPSLSALISQHASAHRQGSVLGLSQSLGSLARALGPLCGLTLFQIQVGLSFWVAGCIYFVSLIFLLGSSTFMGAGMLKKSLKID